MSKPMDFDPVVAREVPETDATRAPRGTGGITAVAVLALALGAMGLVGGLWGAMGLAVGSQMQSMFTPPSGGAQQNEMAEIQAEMTGAMFELNRRYMWFHVPNFLIQAVVCVALLIGGIQTIRMKPSGRRLLLKACCAALVLEIVRVVPTVLLQLQALAINRRFAERIMDSVGDANMPASGQFGDVMGTMMTAMTIAMMVVGFAWVLTKIIYYAFTVLFLRKPHVIERFS